MNAYAEKIRQKRLAVGKSEREMADLIGINLPSYCDLERHDNEVLNCLSLRELNNMCEVLNLTPADLLSKEANSNTLSRVSFAEFIGVVQGHIESNGFSVQGFEDKAGWELGSLLNAPDKIWERNVQFLRDVCAEVGIDWRRVLPA